MISIIIPIHNGLKHTSVCLSNLYVLFDQLGSKSKNISIIVIDDGSTDDSAKWIMDNFPQTILLSGDGTLWWSGAVNLGTKYALEQLTADYILWWNNDILPSNDYFSKLFEILNQNEIYIGGSKIYYAHDKDIIWSMGGIFNTRTGKKYLIGMNEKDSNFYTYVNSVDWLPGMGTFIHKSIFDKIGYVDNANFPQYHGDSDFTFKAKLAGYTINVFPELKIWNDKSNSGLLHQNSTSQLIRSLKDVKSNYHMSKDISFYRRYSTSIYAYQTLAYKYCYYVGGFIKWKLLNILGFNKKETH